MKTVLVGNILPGSMLAPEINSISHKLVLSTSKSKSLRKTNLFLLYVFKNGSISFNEVDYFSNSYLNVVN